MKEQIVKAVLQEEVWNKKRYTKEYIHEKRNIINPRWLGNWI